MMTERTTGMSPRIPVRRNVRRRARYWRRLTILGGLVLAAGFLMPISSCIKGLVPAKHVRWFMEQDPEYMVFGFSGTDSYALCILNEFFVHVAPYLFGLVIAMAAFARGRQSNRFQRLTSWAVLCVALLGCISVILCAADGTSRSSGYMFRTRGADGFKFILLPGLLLAYSLLAAWRARRANWCYAFVGLIGLLAWGAKWIGRDQSLYGMYVSYGACIVLLISTLGEAAVLTNQGVHRVVWQLLTCRLAEDQSEPYCTRCGYCLLFLTEQRCPECGRSFTLAEIGAAPKRARAAAPIDTAHPRDHVAPT